MADNYLEFSETLDTLTPEEAAWLEQQLGEDQDTGCPVFLLNYEDRDPDDTDCGFAYSFEESDGIRHLWLYADESGNADHAAHLVQKFLKQFRPDQCWSLTYATTCSKLRVGEFAGGAVFVTADEIRTQNAYDFIEDCTKAFQRQIEVRRLVQEAERLGIQPEGLDDAVHDAASVPASSVNNGGLDEQIAYLVKQFGFAAAEETIKGLAEANNREEGEDHGTALS